MGKSGQNEWRFQIQVGVFFSPHLLSIAAYLRAVFVLFAPRSFIVIGQWQEKQTVQNKQRIRGSKRKVLELKQANISACLLPGASIGDFWIINQEAR